MSRTALSWRLSGNYKGNLLEKLPTASTKEVRSMYDVVTDRYGSVTTQYSGKVKFLGSLLERNGLTFLPQVKIDYPAKVNLPKDIDYLEQRFLAEKWGIGNESILSLAGARPYHISLILGQTTGTFRTFVLKKADFKQMNPYCASLTFSTNINFFVERMNVLKFMKQTREKYQVIDLDLCAKLHGITGDIVEAINNCADQRCVVGITHTMRGYSGLHKSDVYRARENLLAKLQDKFDILDGKHTYYWNSIQMFRETLVLQRKAA